MAPLVETTLDDAEKYRVFTVPILFALFEFVLVTVTEAEIGNVREVATHYGMFAWDLHRAFLCWVAGSQFKNAPCSRVIDDSGDNLHVVLLCSPGTFFSGVAGAALGLFFAGACFVASFVAVLTLVK